MVTAELFIIAQKWKQHKSLLSDAQINKTLGLHIEEYYFAIKMWRTDTCNIIDKPWKHYANIKNPFEKEHISYNSIYVKYSK